MDRMPVTPPEPSWRKPAGILLLLLAIAVWAVAVVMLVEALRLPDWAAAFAFVAGGFAWLWLLPMKRLLRWMELGRWRD
jgi:hypothetical protein